MRHLSGRGVLMSSHEYILYLNIESKDGRCDCHRSVRKPSVKPSSPTYEQEQDIPNDSAVWVIHNTPIQGPVSI